MFFDDEFGHEPTVRIPPERKRDLMRTTMTATGCASIPMRPASCSDTMEMPIPPELLAATAPEPVTTEEGA